MTTCTISPADFEKALARACLKRVTRNDTMDLVVQGDAVAVTFGAFTADVATEARIPVHQARRRLLSLHSEGVVLRDDRGGGRTSWWPVGLAEAQRPPAKVAAAVPDAAAAYVEATQRDAAHRQALTATFTARQHWSDVLGVARDCSTSEARAAFAAAIAPLDESDPDYPNQRRRVHDAIDACCREHEIQIQE